MAKQHRNGSTVAPAFEPVPTVVTAQEIAAAQRDTMLGFVKSLKLLYPNHQRQCADMMESHAIMWKEEMRKSRRDSR